MSILKHESDVWATADLLRGAGIKTSDFPKYMMPFFALIMVESRLIREAKRNKLVVGSQARILYADAEGRAKIAKAFNDAIKNKEIGAVVLGRDHHDVSGTDSPYRETQVAPLKLSPITF